MLKDLLTIVIPCKNEKWELLTCLNYIYKQKDIEGTRVILADSSTKPTSQYVVNYSIKKYREKLKIDVVKGGRNISEGRLHGSEAADTKYILFLDADTCITKESLLSDILSDKNEYDLATVTLTTQPTWKWMYSFLYPFQLLLNLLHTPYAPGNFQLWKMSAYWESGGYNPNYTLAEDFAVSKNVHPTKFKIYKTNGVWTDPDTFKKRGHWYMFEMLIRAYFNRNNPKFFTKLHL